MHALRHAVAALACCAAFPASAAADWSAPHEVAAPAGLDPYPLSLGANERGDAALAWARAGGITIARAPRGGDRFDVLDEVSTAPVDQLDGPVLTGSSAAPAIAWVPQFEGEDDPSEVYVLRCAPLGRCPARPERVARVDAAINPELTLGPRGRALVSWETFEFPQGVLARRGGFGPPRRLAGAGYFSGDTFAFGRRGGGEFVFTRNGHVRSARLTPAGRLSPSRSLGRLRGLDGGSTSRVEGVGRRQVIGFTSRYDEETRRFHLSVGSRGRGGRFGRVRDLGLATPEWTLGVARSGAAVLAWVPDEAPGEIRALVRRAGGGFGRPRVVARAEPGQPVSALRVAVAGDGRAALLWQAGPERAPGRLRAAVIRRHVWATQDLAVVEAGAPVAGVSIDVRGRGWAAWADPAGRVLASRLTP